MLNFILMPLSEVRVGAAGTHARLCKFVVVLARDVELLTSLYLARFILRRELRRRRGQARV
jgi:hypothetical protein